jgi:hypothetical protein
MPRTYANGLHPSLRRRIGSVAETVLLTATCTAIWGSVGWVLIGALLR